MHIHKWYQNDRRSDTSGILEGESFASIVCITCQPRKPRPPRLIRFVRKYLHLTSNKSGYRASIVDYRFPPPFSPAFFLNPLQWVRWLGGLYGSQWCVCWMVDTLMMSNDLWYNANIYPPFCVVVAVCVKGELFFLLSYECVFFAAARKKVFIWLWLWRELEKRRW